MAHVLISDAVSQVEGLLVLGALEPVVGGESVRSVVR